MTVSKIRQFKEWAVGIYPELKYELLHIRKPLSRTQERKRQWKIANK